MKKNLAIFINTLGKGGAEKVASILISELSKEYNIFLVMLKNEIVYEIPKNVSISIIGINPLAYKRFCEKNKIDISLSLLTKPNFISIASKILGNKTKTIVSEHTNTLIWYSKAVQKVISFLYPKANNVICVSKKIEYNLNTFLGIKNTNVIYNPYEIGKILENDENTKEDIDFISMGTLYDVKNHELLIRAFANIKDKTKNLYILGDGKLRSKLENLVSELEISKRVFFLGFQSNPFKYLKKAKVFVLSSNNEGLPNAIIEALACNCAIISTDCISGPREILAPDTDFNLQLKNDIEYAKYGVLVPIKNEKLLSHAMENIDIENYTKKALERAKEFDVDMKMKEYKELLCVDL